MKLTHSNGLVEIQVYDSTKESHKIAFSGDDELSNAINELIFMCSVRLDVFAKELLNLYKRIIKKLGIEGFERHWLY